MNTSSRQENSLADRARMRIAISSVLLPMIVFVGISDAGGKTITAAEFFDALTEGTFAVVHGAEIASTDVLAEQLELNLDH